MQEGYNTRVRQHILRMLGADPGCAVTAGDVLKALADAGEPVSKTTVYRCLDRLAAERRVLKYVADDGKRASYICADEGRCAEHLHLQCSSCGKVIHLDCDFMDDIIGHISDKHGFDLRCDSSILYGRCADCVKKGE